MPYFAEVGEEFFHPFHGGTPLVLSYVSFQFVVLEVCESLNHEHCSRALKYLISREIKEMCK